MKRLDLVYEIGTEEIPAGYLPPAAGQLRDLAARFFAEARLDAASIETHATPRRLVLFVSGVHERQEDRTEEVTGPPVEGGVRRRRQPDEGGAGIRARPRAGDRRTCVQVETERGPYVGATVEIAGRAAVDLLAEALPEITAKINFPKTMKWGPGKFRFARPIRWMLALLGDAVVPFEIEGVKTGNLTYGHRILAKGPFEVRDASGYEAALVEGSRVAAARLRSARADRQRCSRRRRRGSAGTSCRIRISSWRCRTSSRRRRRSSATSTGNSWSFRPRHHDGHARPPALLRRGRRGREPDASLPVRGERRARSSRSGHGRKPAGAARAAG